MKLTGKVAIVTGSSRGIGKAIALALAREGADIVVVARTERQSMAMPGTIYQTAEEISSLGRKALAIKSDVSSADDVQSMTQRTLAEFGRIDILVNNAGVVTSGEYRVPILKLPIEFWDKVMRVNINGVFLCTKAVLPTMLTQKSGCIINISSLRGSALRRGVLAYGVSKAAIDHFTFGLAAEVREFNIGVYALSPMDRVDTEMARTIFSSDPHKSRWLNTEAMAEAVVWFATQDPKQLTGVAVASTGRGHNMGFVYGRGIEEPLCLFFDE